MLLIGIVEVVAVIVCRVWDGLVCAPDSLGVKVLLVLGF